MVRCRGLPFQTRFRLWNLIVFLIGVAVVVLLGLLLYSSRPARIKLSRTFIKPIQLSEDERNFKSSCLFHSCFEINRCAFGVHDKIGVYVHPEFEYVENRSLHSYVPQASLEYLELLKVVRDGPYYQPDPTRACVSVPSVDLLNLNGKDDHLISAMLDSLPGWNGGRNHLIFSMLPGSQPDYNAVPDFHYGKAMLAGGSFTRATYRHGYDVSIPVFNPLTIHDRYSTTARESQRHLLLAILNHGWYRKKFDPQLVANSNVVSLEVCPPGEVSHDQLPWKRCSSSAGKVFAYPDVLEQSQFCLLLSGMRHGTPDFTDAMMTGCIPVVLGDDYILPFSEKLDWYRASVRVWADSLKEILEILEEFPTVAVTDMREQVLLLYRRYFSSMGAIATTTLNIINERVFPTAVRGYEWWNNKRFESFNSNAFQYSHPVGISLPTPSPSEGFTALILTYDRVPMLFEVIRSVANAPSLAKVLVIWNNVNKMPPPADQWPRIKKPIQVIKSRQNKLNNRFYPYAEIQTAAILSLDDDITMLTADELEFGYKAWQEFPDRLVGFPGRVHVYDHEHGKWKYESNWLNNISLVLTGAAFYHKFYHFLYTNVMPVEIRDFVDKHMNCEDIAMNYLIANFTRQPPLKVSPRKKFKCTTCLTEESLWSDPQHYLERDECINVFEKFFKGLPLPTVKFRLDPVLYKDPIEDRFKSYPNMGDL